MRKNTDAGTRGGAARSKFFPLNYLPYLFEKNAFAVEFS
jgi:hypothetical protein